MRRPVVLVAADGIAARIVYHSLAQAFEAVEVILEERIAKQQLLRGRTKTLGWPTVVGQVLFMGAIMPLLERGATSRISQILAQYDLSDAAIPVNVTRVSSLNSNEARQSLQRCDPGVVVVIGTRILERRTLQSVDALFINLHAGITPLYRGVHGGYWAFAEGRPDLAGTTIHLVDVGIDTGDIIEQCRLEVTSSDSFATYPYLHLAIGIPMLIRAIRSAAKGELVAVKNPLNLPSRIRSHPTAWGYVATRLRRSVR